MSRNLKLAIFITIEYVVGMLLCAFLVGATTVSHVAPVIIICICGTILVSTNTKITGDTEEKKNRSIVSYFGSIKLVMLLGMSFEEGYGNISTTFVVCGFIVTAIVFFTEMYMYMKNTRSKVLKYYVLIMYIVMYILVAFNVDNLWAVLFCLPLLTSYSQFEDVKLMVVGVVATDIITISYLLKYTIFAGEKFDWYKEWNAIVVIILMVVYSFVLIHSTMLLNMFSNNRIEAATEEQERVEKLTDEMMDIKEEVYQYANEAEEIIGLLSKSVNNTLSKLEVVVKGNIDNVKNIENQSEITAEIKGYIDELNIEVANIASTFNSSIMDLETSKEYMDVLNDISNLVDRSNKEVMRVIKEFVDNAKLVREITEGITDISEQTNLLSLNASIESVRAGEIGKGFSVVANEIRKLAEETSKLTENIGNIVGSLEKSADVAQLVAKDVEDAVEEENKNIEDTSKEFYIMGQNMYVLRDNIDEISSSTNRVEEFNMEIQQHIINLSASGEELSACIEEGTNISNSNNKKVSSSADIIKDISELANEIGKVSSANA